MLSASLCFALCCSRECKDPCYSNPLCRGYCALLGAYLWEKEGGTSLEDAFLSRNDAERDDKITDMGAAHSSQSDVSWSI